jgi:putrescine aminotransferase|tara:strand:- start:1878 stop:2996 length:1119 start_codon:yes stop_codon:yes gene_type:complete
MKEILSFQKFNAKADVLVSAENYHLHLKTGEVLIDTMSGLWCTPLGYSNKKIKSAMTAQLKKLPYGNNFTGNQNHVTEKYAKKLCKITNMDRVYFTNSGSSAVETAVKLTKRTSVACGKHSYHGSTILSSNVSDQSINKFWNIPNPLSVFKFEDAASLKYWKNHWIADASTTFCIIEPVIGAGGVYEWEPEVFDVLKEYQKAGGLVIFDEVVTGFGKLGTMFAFEKYNFEPDILVLGKAITNGYFPMGACLIKDHVLTDTKFFNHGFTFSGHPVGCAAALATLKELEKTSTISFDLKLKYVKKHRQIGCMGAIDFETTRESLKFIKKMRERGYIMEDGSENTTTAVYCLPYIITREDYVLFIENMQEAINVS